jgi:hypothetical protein
VPRKIDDCLIKSTDYYSAIMFLIPFVYIGYNIWERKKKEEDEEQIKKNGPQAPESVEGPVIEDTPDILTRQDSDTSSDSDSPREEEESDSDMALTSFAPSREKEGPFTTIRKFFDDAQGNNAAFRIKANEDNLTFEVMGNQGDLALNFPRISFK